MSTPETPSSAARALPVLAAAPGDHGHWLASRASLEPYRDATLPTRAVLRDAWLVAEALFTTTEGPPPPARLGWLCAELADFLGRIGPRARWTFRLALWFVAWSAPLALGRLPPLARLSQADRFRALERMERGGMAQTAAILAVKAVLCILYYEHPDAAAEIDFDGCCMERAS
jgi:hypothetical protein